MLMIKHDDALKTIGEVSSLIEVPVYVIRFWETKFKDLNPVKKIKYLLYEKKLTINGTIQNIEELDTQKKIIIDEIKELINEIKNNL